MPSFGRAGDDSQSNRVAHRLPAPPSSLPSGCPTSVLRDAPSREPMAISSLHPSKVPMDVPMTKYILETARENEMFLIERHPDGLKFPFEGAAIDYDSLLNVVLKTLSKLCQCSNFFVPSIFLTTNWTCFWISLKTPGGTSFAFNASASSFYALLLVASNCTRAMTVFQAVFKCTAVPLLIVFSFSDM